MMEGYILHAPNNPERNFRREFQQQLGEQALADFDEQFRGAYIRPDDFKTIAGLGLNCVRVPFHHRLIEKETGEYDPQGVKYLDDVIQWAKDRKIWVILDLHAAPGCQNHDWHSDSEGQAELWSRPDLRKRTAALWSFLAERYCDEPWVAGYDLLNEAVIDDAALLNQFYDELIAAIREKDRNHVVFVEGNRWATDLNCLKTFDDDNLCLSVHFYCPLDFAFTFVPGLSYPLDGKPHHEGFDRSTIQSIIGDFARTAQDRQRPVLVGEFGVNVRQGHYGEDQWLADTLEVFEENGFHWTYWTYKAIKNGVFPDGLFSYYPNPAWVNRMGPRSGWDTYASCWKTRRRAMIESWTTEHFTENRELTAVIKQAAGRK